MYQGNGEDYIRKSFIIYSNSSPNVIWMIRRLRWAKNVERTGPEDACIMFW